jgi:uncharacterized protein (TIGR03435 family)
MQSFKASLTLSVIGILGILSVAQVQSQTPAARPEFEVASVKPNSSGGRGMKLEALPGARLNAENVPLRLLIQNAYGVRSFQISGGPAWIDSDRWDITALGEGNASPRDLMVMLETLIEDRFKLEKHKETKEFTLYALVEAKGGLKLPNANAEPCVAASPLLPRPEADAGAPKPCGRAGVILSPKGSKLRGKNITTAELTRVLSNILDRNVLDKTGFKGTFDVDVDFTPDQVLAGLPNRGPDEPSASADAGGTSIFAALQQLGLKLESTKGPVPMLIIDHVEKPSAN